MQKTKIEYLTHTWNPIKMQCTPISEGCQNCWSLAINRRFKNKPEKPELDMKELEAPMRLRKPARIGVQFMGDLFHEDVPFRFIAEIFNRIRRCPQHIFQVLTKRPKRMLEFCEDLNFVLYPNLWIGVTCENQRCADIKIPILLEIPAAVRFISIEPCLENILISAHYLPQTKYLLSGGRPIYGDKVAVYEDGKFVKGIDWVIIGCESGAKRRECKFGWVWSIVEQCKYANVPVFVKQIPIDGKVCKDINKFPKELQFREYPKGR